MPSERTLARRRILGPAIVSRHLTYAGALECWKKCHDLKKRLGRSSGWERIDWDIIPTWYGYRVQVRNEYRH